MDLKTKTYRLGSLFSERKEHGESNLPIFSVTINSGLVRRDSLDRRVDSALPPEKHLVVRKNDLAYNMMRMWQGVVGLAPEDGLVSPAYVVVIPNEKIDPLFASKLFKSAKVIHMFRRFSQGITEDKLRLYYDQFKDIKLTIPESVDTQHAIAKLINSIDQRASFMKEEAERLKNLSRSVTQILF